MNAPTDITEALLRVVRGVADKGEQRRVAAWRKKSDANEEQYREFVWMATLADRAFAPETVAPPDPAMLIAAANRRAQTTKTLPTAARGWSGRSGFLRVAAAALLIVGLGAIGQSLLQPDGTVSREEPIEYRTSPDEQRSIKLADGTLAHLGPATTLRIYGDPAAPRLWIQGRAFFGVPKKDDRQLVIETDAGRVTVLGTRFDLRSVNGDLQLLVVDGEVSVAAGAEEAAVGSGDLGLVNGGDLEAVVRVEDPFAYLSWMESAMVFQATPFSRAAEELAARYGLTIDIRDTAVMERTITTSFSGRNLEEALIVMCGVVHASCVLDGQTVTVTSM